MLYCIVLPYLKTNPFKILNIHVHCTLFAMTFLIQLTTSVIGLHSSEFLSITPTDLRN